MAHFSPILSQAFDVELSGVSRSTEGDMARITAEIIDAMRDDFPLAKTGKVMVKASSASLAQTSSRAIKAPKVLFFLGVHTQYRVVSGQVIGPEMGDSLELGIPMRDLFFHHLALGQRAAPVF